VYEDLQATLKASGVHAVAYTLKIRSGVAVDSAGKAAGKGPLVQVEKAATLSTTQDQYLFAPTAYSFDSLASNSMKSSNPHSGCRQVEVAKTLDTTDPNPCKNQGGIAIVEPQMAIMDNIGGQVEYGKVTEINGTLRAGGQGLVCYPVVCMATQQGGAEIRTDDRAPTITAAAGMSGNNQPVVVYDARGNGDGEVVSTLTGDHNNRITDYSSVVVEPAPVYCLQGNGIDRADTAGCNGKGVKEDICYTLNTIDRPAVAYCTDVGFFNSQEEQSPTLLARQYKDPHLVTYPMDQVHYIVRRLTPTECARLQGFADRWGDIDEKDSFTPEEYEFWLTVRNTHAAINGKAVKDYTEAQMLTWYSKLQTDSAEYKMWGNGIALPTALYCMQGISEVLHKEVE
jgi:DNA (cytosine-5)-methyltransferase 1